MKKTVKTTLIVAGSLMLAGMILFAIACAFGARPVQIWNGGLPEIPYITTGTSNDYKDWNNNFSDDGAYSVSAKELNSFDFKWTAGTVKVIAYDGDEVLFTERAADTISRENALRFGVKNGVLYIQYCEKGTGERLPEKKLTVRVPKDLAAKMKAFSFDASSASLEVSGLRTKKFTFDSTSGQLHATSITAHTVGLDSASGDINFSSHYDVLNADSTSGQVKIASLGKAVSTSIGTSSGDVALSGHCGELSANTTSGEISSSDTVTAKELEVYTSSGDVCLSGTFLDVQAGTTSGAVTLRSKACPDELYVDTSSGEVRLALPTDSEFTLMYGTASGELRCDFSVAMREDRFVSGAGTANFNVDTTSGDLTIEKSNH